ncbi:O-antigen ligase family protein [Spiribacter vilamensis]|uniref:O-antigen ligase n=1 Tax=Spiribacter vilamensis TaxID=531306 RepID=A0A4Q8D207_9GAMM|nr:O-antigen ligase family protein [Spiribacter vilamensis]RZU99408.1 O-antigen ligase [Spiribacter vilamensis]TVO61617.1 O-antigen ligase family protein [Spiribacter vilamensis]
MRKLNINAGGFAHSATDNSLAFGIFLLPTLSLALPSGYSYGIIIILLSAIAIRVFDSEKYQSGFALSTPVSLIILSLVLYAVFWIGDAALRGEGVSDFDRPIRFLIAALCLSVIARTRIDSAWLWMGLGLGSINAGSVALWQWTVNGASRASGFAPTNKFGLIAITMALMCLSGLIWSTSTSCSGKKRFFISGLLVIGSFFGFTAAMLSGSRGAWIALIPATIVYSLVLTRILQAKYILRLTSMLGLFVILLVYILPTSNIVNRLEDAGSQLEAYVNGDFVGGSVGFRLEMWKGAGLLFIERPYIGWGELGYYSKMHELETNGAIQEHTARFTHAHNDWFNVLAKKGLAGGLILLAVYFTPLVFFIQTTLRAGRAKVVNTHMLALSVSGIVLVCSFMSVGIAQVTFNRNIGIMFYAFMIAVLVGLLARDRLPQEN